MSAAALELPVDPVRLLAAGLAGLQDVTAVGLGDELRELFHCFRQFEAEISRRVAVFDGAGAGSVDGALTTRAWLASRCRLSPSEAGAQVRVARYARELPATRGAYLAGDLSAAHVDVIGKAVSELDSDEDVAAADGILSAAGAQLSTDKLRKAGQHLRELVNPDAGLDAADRTYRKRDLSVTPVGDEVLIRGVLDAEGGATVIAALDAVMTPPAPDDTRTPGQRRADGLVDLSRQALDSDDLPEVAGQRPHLVVTIDYDTLAGRLPEPTVSAETTVDSGGRLPEWLTKASPVLDGVGPVTPATARRLACDCGVIPAVLGSDSAVLDLGRHTRVISAALRRALALRDGRCRFPGCDRPPQWTDAHHWQHWIDGGPTSLANLILLCRRHHRLVHEGGWTLEGNPDGAVHARRPDGSVLTLAPPRRKPANAPPP